MGKDNDDMEERYATEGELRQKAGEWLAEVREYTRRGFEFEPKSSALLVIDMQKFFLSPDSHAFLPAARAMIPNVNGLIGAFREANRPVIFTRHAYMENEDPGIMGQWWADSIRDADPVSEIEPALGLHPSDVVIRKTRYNAFFGTNLEDILKKRQTKQIVITGVMTHLCCETTAREAFTRDYEVYFVVDGTATADEKFHISSIRNLAHGFAIPASTEQILSRFKGN
jgi:isochorismate hydrolase